MATAKIAAHLKNSNRQPAAVVTPIYKAILDQDEALALSHNLNILAQSPWILIHPPSNRSLIEEIISQHPKISITSIELGAHNFVSIASYNKMLLSSFFYRQFEAYTHILIAQLDTLIFADQFSNWVNLGYAYMGSPWYLGIDNPNRPLQWLGGGNGGLSLRHVQASLDVLARPRWLYRAIRRYEHQSLPGEWLRAELRALRQLLERSNGTSLTPKMYEDLFWSFIAPRLNPAFSVAPPEIAIDFAWELHPRAQYQQRGQLPFGCHAWQRYDRAFWLDILAKQGADHRTL
jgi:hypothetical protein